MIDKVYNLKLLEKLKEDYQGMSDDTLKLIYPFEISSYEHQLVWAKQTKKGLERIREDSSQAYNEMMIDKPFKWITSWEGEFYNFEIAFNHLKQAVNNGNQYENKKGEKEPYTYRDAWLLSWDKDLYDKIIYKKQKSKYDKKPFKERMIYT